MTENFLASSVIFLFIQICTLYMFRTTAPLSAVALFVRACGGSLPKGLRGVRAPRRSGAVRPPYSALCPPRDSGRREGASSGSERGCRARSPFLRLRLRMLRGALHPSFHTLSGKDRRRCSLVAQMCGSEEDELCGGVFFFQKIH